MASMIGQVPGFRSGKSWKKVVAVLGYVMIALYVIVGVTTGNVAALILGLEGVAAVLILANAWGLRSRLPLFSSPNGLVSALGWVVLVIVALVLVMASSTQTQTAGTASRGSAPPSVASTSAPAAQVAGPMMTPVLAAATVPPPAATKAPPTATPIPPTLTPLPPTQDPAQALTQLKSEARAIPYKDLARNPDTYIGVKVKYTGKVIQVQEAGNNVGLRVNVTKGDYGLYGDTVFVAYDKGIVSGRVLEDDIISFWGTSSGLLTYKTVLGAEMTIPEVLAQIVELSN